MGNKSDTKNRHRRNKLHVDVWLRTPDKTKWNFLKSRMGADNNVDLLRILMSIGLAKLIEDAEHSCTVRDDFHKAIAEDEKADAPSIFE